MEKAIIRDILNNFHSGIITDVSRINNDIVLTIDLTELNDYPSLIFRCELKNCTIFQMKYRKESIEVENFKRFNIKILNTNIVGECVVI